MEKFRIWMMQNEYVNAVLFCDTLGVYSVTEREKEVLRRLNSGENVPESDEKTRIVAIFEMEEQAAERMAKTNCDVNPFYTLILNVANTCNMRCKYCFANHGTYDSETCIMQIQTAVSAVDSCIESYGQIGEVKFFGGEPILAMPVMQAVTAHLAELLRAGKINRLPEFRVISNGTIMNDAIAAWLQEYHVQYVVSLDGFRQIHDSARIMASGEGSYECIMNNLADLRSRYDLIPAGIEITYNGIHESCKTNLLALISFLHETTGVAVENINLSPVMTAADNSCSLERMDYVLVDYLDALMDEIRKTGNNYADKKFRGLVRIIHRRMRSGNQICEAGTGCIAVSASGEIYPCLMFVDKREYRMGQVGASMKECSTYFIRDQLSESARLQNAPCSNCPVNRICRQCMGINLFQTGRIDLPDPEQCRLNRRRIEKAVLGIAEGLF